MLRHLYFYNIHIKSLESHLVGGLLQRLYFYNIHKVSGKPPCGWAASAPVFLQYTHKVSGKPPCGWAASAPVFRQYTQALRWSFSFFFMAPSARLANADVGSRIKNLQALPPPDTNHGCNRYTVLQSGVSSVSPVFQVSEENL